MKNRNTIFTTAAEGMKKLTLALLVAAALNPPPAEAIFIPLSLQPGGPLHTGVSYTFRLGDAAGGTAVMLQAVVRNRLELEETATVSAGGRTHLLVAVPLKGSPRILRLHPLLPGGPSTAALPPQNAAT